MNNATVSDTKVSFAASLYEACRRHRLRCSNFAMAELSDQEVRDPGSGACRSVPVCRFPIFCYLHHLFESSAAFEQRAFERGLERLFRAGIVERHLVLTHRLHQPGNLACRM